MMAAVQQGPGTPNPGEPYGERRGGPKNGNGNGDRYDRLLERIHGVENAITRIETRLDNTATKADLQELQSNMLKYFIATLIAAIATVATVVGIFSIAG